MIHQALTSPPNRSSWIISESSSSVILSSMPLRRSPVCWSSPIKTSYWFRSVISMRFGCPIIAFRFLFLSFSKSQLSASIRCCAISANDMASEDMRQFSNPPGINRSLFKVDSRTARENSVSLLLSDIAQTVSGPTDPEECHRYFHPDAWSKTPVPSQKG